MEPTDTQRSKIGQIDSSQSPRRLTSILITDICEFSRLAEADEASAIRLTDVLFKLFEETTQRQGGRVFKRIADGFLAEFPSAQSAMAAALEFLSDVKARNNLAPNAIHAEVRAALHVGDVTDRADGDIMGHGVNIAARLQVLAEPGTILASSNIMNLLGKDFPYKGVKRARLSLRNISTPMTAFQIDPDNQTFTGRLKRKIQNRTYSRREIALALTFAFLVSASIGFAFYNYHQRIEAQNQFIAAQGERANRQAKLATMLDEYDQSNELDRRYLSELLHDLDDLSSGAYITILLENSNKVNDVIAQLKDSLNDITTGDPKYIQTLHFIGALAYQIDPDESEAAYKLILDLDPNDVEAMIRLARVYDVIGQSETALQLFEKAYSATIDPDKKRWLENDIAFNHLIMGNYDLGLKMYESLYGQIGSDIPEESRLASRLHTDLGVAYYLTNNINEAKALGISGIRKQKQYGHYYDLARSHNLMGFLYTRDSEVDPVNETELLNSALYHYEKQLEYSQELKNPRRLDEARIGLGEVYTRLGDLEAARNQLNQGALSANPLQKFEALFFLAELEWGQANQQKACDYLLQAKQIDEKLRAGIGPERKARIEAIKCSFSFF